MDAKDLLVVDLEHIRRSLLSNEELGAKRLSFFLTVAIAVVSGLAALAAGDRKTLLVPSVVNGVLAGLLIVGALTYLRMIHRNRVTDHLKEMADYVWSVGIDLCPDLNGRLYKLDWAPKRDWPKWLRAGYAETVAAINGVLVAVFFATSLNIKLPFAILSGLSTAALLWIVASRRGDAGHGKAGATP